MKELKFKFNMLPSLLFRIPIPLISWKRERILESVVSITYVLSLIIVFLTFPVLLFLSKTDWQFSSSLIIAIAIFLIGILLFNFIIQISLIGKKLLTDPVGFMPVLFFALGIIATAVFTATNGSDATFGTDSTRIFSGLFVMLMLALFYLLNLYINNRVLLKRFVAFKTGAILILAAFLIFQVFSYDFGIVYMLNAIEFALLALFVLLGGIYLSKFRMLKKTLVLLFVFGIIFAIMQKGIVYLEYVVVHLWVFDLALFAAWLILAKYTFSSFKLQLKSVQVTLQKFVKSKDTTIFIKEQLGKNLLGILIFLSPFLIGVILCLIMLFNKLNFTFLQSIIESIWTNLTTLGNNSVEGNNIRQILTGKGISSFNSLGSLLYNIISISGLIGLVSYFILIVSGIFFSIKTIRRSSTTLNVYLLPAFTIIYLSIFFLVFTPSILTMILWWISFSLITISFGGLTKQTSLKVENFTLKLRGKILNGRFPIFRLIFLFAVGVILFLTITGLTKIILG